MFPYTAMKSMEWGGYASVVCIFPCSYSVTAYTRKKNVCSAESLDVLISFCRLHNYILIILFGSTQVPNFVSVFFKSQFSRCALHSSFLPSVNISKPFSRRVVDRFSLPHYNSLKFHSRGTAFARRDVHLLRPLYFVPDTRSSFIQSSEWGSRGGANFSRLQIRC